MWKVLWIVYCDVAYCHQRHRWILRRERLRTCALPENFWITPKIYVGVYADLCIHLKIVEYVLKYISHHMLSTVLLNVRPESYLNFRVTGPWLHNGPYVLKFSQLLAVPQWFPLGTPPRYEALSPNKPTKLTWTQYCQTEKIQHTIGLVSVFAIY